MESTKSRANFTKFHVTLFVWVGDVCRRRYCEDRGSYTVTDPRNPGQNVDGRKSHLSSQRHRIAIDLSINSPSPAPLPFL